MRLPPTASRAGRWRPLVQADKPHKEQVVPLKLGVIGCGLKAASYAASWTAGSAPPRIVAITDTSPAAAARYAAIVAQSGAPAPEVDPDGETLLARGPQQLDAVYISTPHVYHQAYARAALKAGLNVLLEKPMALSADEARQIIAARDAAGKAVVVAYQSSLSPLIAGFRRRIMASEFGALLSVSGEVWEHWETRYAGNWKQVPELSGGGFICDTGSHLFNAVIQATGRGYTRVAGALRSLGRPYELVGGVLAEIDGDVPVTLNFCGNTTTGCESTLSLFFETAILRLDIWGKWAELRQGATITREAGGEPNDAVLDVFTAVLGGAPNPATAEQSLHLADLWDLIRKSGAEGSIPLPLTTRPEAGS